MFLHVEKLKGYKKMTALIARLEKPREASQYLMSLNGVWRFTFYTNSTPNSPTPNSPTPNSKLLSVPGCWQLQGDFDPLLYTNSTYPFAIRPPVASGEVPEHPDWTINRFPDPVGVYEREFEIPVEWTGRRVVIHFGGGTLVPAGCGHDAESAWANWKVGGLDWKCRLTKNGLESSLAGEGDVALQLPAFAFDGEYETEIVNGGKSLCISYRGWVCRYETNGTVHDTGAVCCNRNGRYRVFEARGKDSLAVTICIVKSDGLSNM